MKPSHERQPISSKVQLHMLAEDQLTVSVGATKIAVTSDLQPAHYFLNMQARSLGSLAQRIGGLLGEDSHADVSTPPAGCTLSMLALPRHALHVHASASLTP